VTSSSVAYATSGTGSGPAFMGVAQPKTLFLCCVAWWGGYTSSSGLAEALSGDGHGEAVMQAAMPRAATADPLQEAH
jgi:hypothetical protein